MTLVRAGYVMVRSADLLTLLSDNVDEMVLREARAALFLALAEQEAVS